MGEAAAPAVRHWPNSFGTHGFSSRPQTDLLDAVWENHILHAALHERNDIAEAIGFHDLTSLVDDGGAIDTYHISSAGLGSEHRQDARAAAYVEDHLVGKEVLVVVDGVNVDQGKQIVSQLLLLVKEGDPEQKLVRGTLTTVARK